MTGIDEVQAKINYLNGRIEYHRDELDAQWMKLAEEYKVPNYEIELFYTYVSLHAAESESRIRAWNEKKDLLTKPSLKKIINRLMKKS